MIDLSAFNRKPGESWADIMDEEEEENDRNRHTSADGSKDQPPPPEKPKTSGIVWNIPSSERKKEQRQVMQLLIERRQNIDSLDNWRRKDDNDDSKSWRSNKKYREPEKNNSSGWHAYSQVLQEEYEQEREDARKEFIRRFGSAPGEDDEPPLQPPPNPVVISVSADGPSDWADDLPSDEEDHADYLSDRLSQDLEPATTYPADSPEEKDASSSPSPEEDRNVEQQKEASQQEATPSPPEEPKQSEDPAPPQPVASTVSSSDGWRTGESTDAAPVAPISDSQDDTTVKIEEWRTQVATTSPQQNTAWADFAAQHSQPAKPSIVVDQSDTLPGRSSDAGSEHSWHATQRQPSPPEQRQSQSERTTRPTVARSPRMQILNHLFKNKATRSTDATEPANGPHRWTAFADRRTKQDAVPTDNTSHLEKSCPALKEGERAAASNDDARSCTSRTSHHEKISVGSSAKEEDWRAGATWASEDATHSEKAAPVWNTKEDDGSWRAAAAWTTNNDDAHSHSSHGKPRMDDDARSYTSRTSDAKSEGKRSSSRSSSRIGNSRSNDNDGRASPAWNAFIAENTARSHSNRKAEPILKAEQTPKVEQTLKMEPKVEQVSTVEQTPIAEQVSRDEQTPKEERASKDERASPAWSAFSGNGNIRNHGNRREEHASKVQQALEDERASKVEKAPKVEQASNIEQAPEAEQASKDGHTSKNEQTSPAWNTFGNNDKSHSTNNEHVLSFSNKDNSRGRKNKGGLDSVEDDSWRAAATWTTSWSNPSSLKTSVDQVTNMGQALNVSQTVNVTQPSSAKQAAKTESQVSGESRWQAYAKEHSTRINRSTTPTNKPWS